MQHRSEVSGKGKSMELRFDVVQEHKESGEEAEAVAEDVVVDVLARKEDVVSWLSRHCIYCEMTGRYLGSDQHWHRDCKKSQSVPDDCEYRLTLDWQCEMDEFRNGKCHSCKLDISECGLRDSSEVMCQYGDVILPVVYILYQQGWLDRWVKGKGVQVVFGKAQMQGWLNESSNEGGVIRSRVEEAFEAFVMEFNRV